MRAALSFPDASLGGAVAASTFLSMSRLVEVVWALGVVFCAVEWFFVVCLAICLYVGLSLRAKKLIKHGHPKKDLCLKK